MTCDGCAKSVSDSLYKLNGINKVEANVKDQLVSIEGTAAPSAIVEAIQATGRDAILRGSGSSNSAAVSILESFFQSDATANRGIPADGVERDVRGLARMVQVSPTSTLIDLTVRGVAPGLYQATIRQSGDLKDGAASTGGIWSDQGAHDGSAARGILGSLTVGPDGRGSAYINHPFQIWEAIGRAMVVSRQDESAGPPKNDPDTVVGVIARSAGVWDNDKTVCSCTGKTLWEERRDEVKRGML
ncbi:superoxide dismutase 1 copper chaperone [Sodiomyces alkalinus F11]|uniref:Superoxide dismutase 1 copper chaperone n=1 Tax=Sodiomyces alkalinus (strain CBS 110278 / VKM F-3762 / F11) TaxID=1314773 RepID=A0A3N2Q5N0_SODAK|nr:superoxide dismutase 1 copper chaperone [Sodiomyces alkalinus F11]ROT42084.1 superoxide dismutase 1 copper chaperone [Sodiomyces alkalinus F11]